MFSVGPSFWSLSLTMWSKHFINYTFSASKPVWEHKNTTSLLLLLNVAVRCATLVPYCHKYDSHRRSGKYTCYSDVWEVVLSVSERCGRQLLVSFKALTLAVDRCWILLRPDSRQTLKAFVSGSGVHLLKQKAHVVPRRALPTETILSGYVSMRTAVSAWAWVTVHVCVWTPGCLQWRRPSVSAWRWKGREGRVSINQARLEAQRLESPFHCSASSALCHETHTHTHTFTAAWSDLD